MNRINAIPLMRERATINARWLPAAWMAAVLASSACSDDLSRSRAQEIISEGMGYPITKTASLDIGERIHDVQDRDALQQLAQEGVIDYVYHRRYGLSHILGVSLTEAGQRFVVGEPRIRSFPRQKFVEVRVADQEMVSVTGVRRSNDGGEALVEYTWKYGKLTPFWILLSNVIDKDEVHEARAHLALYDDGWRLRK